VAKRYKKAVARDVYFADVVLQVGLTGQFVVTLLLCRKGDQWAA
jgi:hypothetical protein